MSGCSLWPKSLWPGAHEETPDEKPELVGEKDPGEIVKPDVQRRDVSVIAIDTERYDMGVFTGVISLGQGNDMGLWGLSATYFYSEALFFELNYASAYDLRHMVNSDEPKLDTNYTYLGVTAGYNLLGGEFYWPNGKAVPFSLYLMGGGGTSDYDADSYLDGSARSTIQIGGGGRFLINDALNVRIEGGDLMMKLPSSVGKGYQDAPYFSVGLSYFF